MKKKCFAWRTFSTIYCRRFKVLMWMKNKFSHCSWEWTATTVTKIDNISQYYFSKLCIVNIMKNVQIYSSKHVLNISCTIFVLFQQFSASKIDIDIYFRLYRARAQLSNNFTFLFYFIYAIDLKLLSSKIFLQFRTQNSCQANVRFFFRRILSKWNILNSMIKCKYILHTCQSTPHIDYKQMQQLKLLVCMEQFYT